MLMLNGCNVERKKWRDRNEKKCMDYKRDQAKESEYNGERWRK